MAIYGNAFRQVTHQDTVTRDNQKPDVVYVNAPKKAVFVSPDGEGRYYYESIAEAYEQHGELPIVVVTTIEE